MSVTTAKEAQKVRVLDRIPCICYPVQFWKDKSKDVLALFKFGSEVNAIISAYTAHLGLKVQKTNIGAWKIDGFSLAIYSIVIAAFHDLDKLGRSLFFQETFLLANISMGVVIGMLFLIISNANVWFVKKELT